MGRADGFSPGNLIVVKVPGIGTAAAFAQNNFTPVNNLRRFDDEGQSVVVFNADTGERHPIWVELDINPVLSTNHGTNADRNLVIRPARNFEEGARYIVVLRDLKGVQGQALEPPMPFRVYRDRLITQQSAVESRRGGMESLISEIQGAGYQRSNLYMAWDFTVASERSLSERALTIRDDAFEDLGDTDLDDGEVDGASPTFTIDSVTDDPNPNVMRDITGTLTDVPCYLNSDGCGVGSQFTFDGDDELTWNDSFTMDVPFRCIVPNAVVQGGQVVRARPGTYGHGLLGTRNQVTGQARIANEQNSVWCAVDWVGFSAGDMGQVALALTNLSNFKPLADRMQQGFVNFMYLGRAMIHPNGLNTDPAFQVDPDGPDPEPTTPVIDTDELYFEGISQGGIMGGALTALNPDFTRSVLNVPGMNYSTLLRRSVDFDEYAELPAVGLYDSYPAERERPLVLSLMQLLWDRGEANGYAHHMTDDPYEDTPRHDVLLQLALGDHQVANLSAEVEARTIGARVHLPALDPGRHWDANPFMGIPAIDFGPAPFDNPFTGSALVYYDGGPTTWFNDGTLEPQDALECDHGTPLTNPCQGAATPPNDEVPPREETGHGQDPHAYPRRAVDGLSHVDTFLNPDGFILPCFDDGGDPRPCYANGWDGPPAAP